MATERELALVEAALKAARHALQAKYRTDPDCMEMRDDIERRDRCNGLLVQCIDSISALDRAAIVASVPRIVDPELKAALDEAAKAGDLHAVLPNGGVAFINRGEQPEDTADLDCPHCGGSGHKDDVRAALSAQEQVAPTDAEIIKAIANCRHTITDEYVMLYRDPQQDGNALDQFVRRALLSANQGK